MESSDKYENIKNTLSISRMATYEKYSDSHKKALDLYLWNLQISSALLECLAVCEVVVRNSVAKIIEQRYGEDWINNARFIRTMKQSRQRDLIKVRQSTVDKTIAELPFVFWQSFFTVRFDQELWQNDLAVALPNASDCNGKLREVVFTDLDRLRKLRNRIAHHEPIFNRSIKTDYEVIIKIIRYCCEDTANWVESWRKIDDLLEKRP